MNPLLLLLANVGLIALGVLLWAMAGELYHRRRHPNSRRQSQ